MWCWRRGQVHADAQVEQPTAGTLELDGRSVRLASPRDTTSSSGTRKSAQAMAQDVRILIMDEPTSALSAAEIGVLVRLIRDLKSRGVAIVYVSRRLEEVLAIGDRVTVLRDGRAASLEQSITSLSGGNRQKVVLSRFLLRLRALVVLLTVFSILSSAFLTAGNLTILLKHVAINAIMAVGMTFVILSGGIDLSVGSVAGLAGMVARGLIDRGLVLPMFGVAGAFLAARTPFGQHVYAVGGNERAAQL
jgi:ABC-type thiamine transport system ATPase subunit